MTPAQFRALLAANGGLLGTEVLDKSKEEEIAGHKTGEMIPPTSVRLRYTTPNGEITARQEDDGTFAILDDPKGLVKASAPGGDKPIEVGGKLVQKNARGEYVTVYDPAATGAGPKPVEVGGKIVQAQPDGSYKTLWEPPQKGTEPPVNLPARAAGQQTDLSLVESQANAFIAATNADTNLTPAQRRQRVATYIDTVVKPAHAVAMQEINAEAARLQQRQERADVRAETSADAAGALGRAQFAYGAGRDAVSDAMSLFKYQANPEYVRSYVDAAGTLSRGGGPVSIRPEAFYLHPPDLNALAEQGAARASALYEAQRGLPMAARPGVGAPGGLGPGAISSSSGATQAALQQAPFTPRPAGPGPVFATPTAYPSATPGVPAGTPSPLPPGWEQMYPQPAAY